MPYKGFGRPHAYHPTAARARKYPYTEQEKATLAEALAIKRRAREYEARIREAVKPVVPRKRKRVLIPKDPRYAW